MGAHVPPPAGLAPPTLWGEEAHVRDLLGGGVREMRPRTRTYTFRFESAEGFTDFFRTHYGPTVAAFAALPEDGRDALAAGT